jgi:hypothetical protein
MAFRGGAFVSEKLFFLKDDPASGATLGSLALERFLPTPDHVHSYGCRLASKTNERKQASGKLNPRSRSVYCGAYRLMARSVRELVGTEKLTELVAADVTHLPEDGEVAHVELRLVFADGATNKEGTKTVIVDRLLHATTGPLRHVCDADIDLNPHPGKALATAFGGECVDRYPKLSHLWRVIRFRLCSWFLA